MLGATLLWFGWFGFNPGSAGFAGFLETEPFKIQTLQQQLLQCGGYFLLGLTLERLAQWVRQLVR